MLQYLLQLSMVMMMTLNYHNTNASPVDTTGKLVMLDQIKKVAYEIPATAYEWKKTDALLNITITDEKQLEQIAAMEVPLITFKSKGVKIVAKPHHILRSDVPYGGNAFFPVDNQGKIVFASGNKIAIIIKQKGIHKD
jgi:proline racemase